MRATSPSLRITAKGHRPQIPPNTAEFLTNGATTPKTQGDCDRVAVDAVYCELVSCFGGESLFSREKTGKFAGCDGLGATTAWLVLWTFQLLSSCLRGVSSREFLCPNREFARACREPPTTTVVATAKMGVSFASSSIRRPRWIATGQRSPAERLLRSARIARSALDGRAISRLY